VSGRSIVDYASRPLGIGNRRARTLGVQSPYVRDSPTPDDSAKPRPVCRHYLPDCMDCSHVLMGQWMTVTSRMPCPTGGRTPCSAATGIPGRRATSLSPTCGARAAPMKASSGTPWSGARQTTAAPPGTARGTTRPAHRPAAALVFPTLRTWLGDRARSGETNTVGSHMGSHRQPTQCDSGSTEAFDNRYLTSHPATVADASRQVGPRSHRGSALLSTPPPRAKVTFQRCALRHLTHVADERTCVPSHRRIRCRRSFCRQALAHRPSRPGAGFARQRPPDQPVVTEWIGEPPLAQPI